MSYVMVYVAAVPAEKKEVYREHATAMAEIFRDHGASRVVECWGDEIPAGENTSFPMAVKAEEGEVVVMGWQEWPDKARQGEGYAAAMQDPRLKEMGGENPFDGARMIFGGFDGMLDLRQIG